MSLSRKSLYLTISIAVAVSVLFSIAQPSGWDSTVSSNASRAIDAYDERNLLTTIYMERIQKDTETASKLKKLSNEARGLSDQARSMASRDPSDRTRIDVERYVAIQCEIADIMKNHDYKNKQVWREALVRSSFYNASVHADLTMFEKFFGSKRLLFKEC